MKASINAKFSVADIKKNLNQVKASFDEVIINRLRFVGEKFIINARNNGNYKDHTGNLRNSIGYAILKDGKLVVSNYKNPSSKKFKTVNLSNSILAEIAERFPKGFVLVGFAGMNYAAAVESKNYDVITSSAITAENDLRKSLDELRKKLQVKK